jgi:hypothetical protein
MHMYLLLRGAVDDGRVVGGLSNQGFYKWIKCCAPPACGLAVHDESQVGAVETAQSYQGVLQVQLLYDVSLHTGHGGGSQSHDGHSAEAWV